MLRSLQSYIALVTLLSPAIAQDAAKILSQAGFSAKGIRMALADGIYSERMSGDSPGIGAIVFEKLPVLSVPQARNTATLAIKNNAAMRARTRLLEHLWLDRIDKISARNILWQGAYAAGLKIKGNIGPGIEVQTKVTESHVLTWVTAPYDKLVVRSASPDKNGLMKAYVKALKEAIQNIDDAVKDPKQSFALAKELRIHGSISNREYTGLSAAFTKIGKQADAIAILDHVWNSKRENHRSWSVEDWVRLARAEDLAGRETQKKDAMNKAKEALKRQFPIEPLPGPKRNRKADKAPQ